PEETVIAMPGRLKWAVFSATSPAYSLLVPQLLEISVAPRRAAVSSAASRSDPYEELASTSTTLQVWQISWAVSTSRAISRAQPGPELASGLPRASVTTRAWHRAWPGDAGPGQTGRLEAAGALPGPAKPASTTRRAVVLRILDPSCARLH